MTKPRTLRFIIGPLLIGGAFAAMLASSLQSNTLRAVAVGELRAADGTPHSFEKQRLRVRGFIGQDAVRKIPLQTAQGIVEVKHFSVVDKGRQIAVEYRDALPDLFKAGGPVQVEGVYISPGIFQADHVLTQCPSKYEAQKSGAKTSQAENAPRSAAS